LAAPIAHDVFLRHRLARGWPVGESRMLEPEVSFRGGRFGTHRAGCRMIRHVTDTRPRSTRNVACAPTRAACAFRYVRVHLLFFYISHLSLRRSPPVLHTLHYALTGDDHFAVVMSLVRADTLAFIPTSDNLRRLPHCYGLVSYVHLEDCPRLLSCLRHELSASSVLASRHAPLSCPPSPPIIPASERSRLSFLYCTHWVGVLCVLFTRVKGIVR
jgi:hypothetical protein